MRVRVRAPIVGIIRGISLSHLVPGVTYDVDGEVGDYLVTIGAADAVASSIPALVVPLDIAKAPDFDKALGGVSVSRISEAADRPRRSRSRKRSRA